MPIYTFYNEVFLAFVEALFLLILFGILNNKPNFILNYKVKSLLFSGLYIIISYWATLYIPLVLHTVFIVAFAIMLLSYITRINIYAAGITVILFLIFLALTESLLLSLETFTLNESVKSVLDADLTKLIHSTISKLLQLGVLILLSRIKKFKLSNLNILKKENSLLVFYILQLFMFSIFIFSLNYAISNKSNIVLYNVFLFSIYISFFIISLIDYNEREKLLKAQQKLKLKEEHIKEMESTINLIRKEKHDFHNHINTIQAICTLKKPDALERIDSYVRKLSCTLLSTARFFETGNEYINVLLTIKNNYAIENNFQMNIDVKSRLDLLNIEENDLVSIISNIIDNAFEALKSSDSSLDKSVSISLYTEENSFFIEISNTDSKIPDNIITKIFEKGFTTKNDSRDHGFGLYIVKELVDRYHGTIQVESDDKLTKFIIKFPLRGDIWKE